MSSPGLETFLSAPMYTTQQYPPTCSNGCGHVRHRIRTRAPYHLRASSVLRNYCLCLPRFFKFRDDILALVTNSYYRLFMHQYAHALRRARFLMVNSSWTKNHVASVVQYKDTVLDSIALLLLPFLLAISIPVFLLKVLCVVSVRCLN
jgi:hypothetical protein